MSIENLKTVRREVAGAGRGCDTGHHLAAGHSLAAPLNSTGRLRAMYILHCCSPGDAGARGCQWLRGTFAFVSLWTLADLVDVGQVLEDITVRTIGRRCAHHSPCRLEALQGSIPFTLYLSSLPPSRGKTKMDDYLHLTMTKARKHPGLTEGGRAGEAELAADPAAPAPCASARW